MLTMDQRRVSLRSALLYEKILACRSIKRFFGALMRENQNEATADNPELACRTRFDAR